MTPLVRKLANQHGVDVSSLSGTGVGGRIRADVEGLTIYPTGRRDGYLLVSSQGDNRFYVYDRRTTEPVSSDLPQRIQARAEGNPFYTLELARLLDEPGGVDFAVEQTSTPPARKPAGIFDVAGKRVGVLISGGNMDLNRYAELLHT